MSYCMYLHVRAQFLEVPNEVVLGLVLFEATKPALRPPVRVLVLGARHRNEPHEFFEAQNVRGFVARHFH